jgi:hypothetical protein
MAWYARGVRAAFVIAAVIALFAASADAAKPLSWSRKRHLAGCEPPHIFYSSQHVAGLKPCCATVEGACGGGTACPGNGLCPDGTACVTGPVVDRPNVILFVADDQGYCHYGNAGECRSTESGTPLPAPKTPNLDVLAAHGTVFPVAHNVAAWCYPSLASILTGRYQKSFNGGRKVSEQYFTLIPGALRGLTGAPEPPTRTTSATRSAATARCSPGSSSARSTRARSMRSPGPGVRSAAARAWRAAAATRRAAGRIR